MRSVKLGGLAVATLAVAGALVAPSPARGQGAVGFQPGVGQLPDGVSLGVTPAVSADRRYVRLSLGVNFQTIDGFSNFPVPGAVAGGGVNRGGLGGLGGGGGLGGLLGGGAGGGGGAAAVGQGGGGIGVVSGMDGPVQSAPAANQGLTAGGYGYGYGPGYGPTAGNFGAPTGYDPFLKNMAVARPVPVPRRVRPTKSRAPAAKKAASARTKPAPSAVVRDGSGREKAPGG